jgi:hypothetical protein
MYGLDIDVSILNKEFDLFSKKPWHVDRRAVAPDVKAIYLGDYDIMVNVAAIAI